MSARIGFDFFVAGFAVQLKLVLLLQAGFSDVIGALVVGLLLVFLDDFKIRPVDPIDIAEGVRSHRTERVLTEQAGLDFDTGEQVAIGRKTGDLLVIQSGTDGQAFKGLALLEQLAEATPVFRLNFDQLAQALDRGVEILDLGRRDFERERRVIARHDRPVTVEDDATIGRNRNQRDAIVFGTRNVVVVLDDLQKDEAPDQQAKTQDHEACRNGDARAETVKVAILRAWCGVPDAQGWIPQIGRLASRSSG